MSMPTKNFSGENSPIESHPLAANKTVTSTMPGHKRTRDCELPGCRV
jgi:hypothetical protein